MSKRVLMIALGLVIGYAAVYFGEGMHVLANESSALFRSDPGAGLTVLAIIGVGIALTIVGVSAWCIAMTAFVREDPHLLLDDELVSVVLVAFVSSSALFGLLAAPFINYGPYPWYWASRWNFLLLLAFVPMALVIHSMVKNANAARHEKKAKVMRDNVTSIRRDAS